MSLSVITSYSLVLRERSGAAVIIITVLLTLFLHPASAQEPAQKVFDQFGYIDRNDNFKIAPQFGFCGPFLDGLALVQTRRDCMSPMAGIDKNGKVLFVTPERGMYNEKDFSQWVIRDPKVTKPVEQSCLYNRVIDINGKKVHQVVDTSRRLIWQNETNLSGSKEIDVATLKFSERDHAEEIKVENAKKQFLSNYQNYESHLPGSSAGHPVSDFVDGRRFSEGLVCIDVTDADKCARKFFIDEDGTLQFELSDKFFIDEDGTLQFELSDKFFKVGDFHEGRAPVLMRVCELDEAGDWVDARLGFINKSGTLVIGCKYRTHYRNLDDIAFSEGLVAVQDQDLFGAIDKSGRIVIPFKYIAMTDFHEGLCAADTLVDSTGKIYDARSNENGYQTKARYFNAYAKALENELQSLPDYGVVRFDIGEPYSKPELKRMIKGTGSKQFDQNISAAVSKIKPPRPGEFMNYGGDMAFVLCQHHVNVAFSPADPQYPLIVERRKVWRELWGPAGPTNLELQKQVDALSAIIGDERILGILGQPIDSDR